MSNNLKLLTIVSFFTILIGVSILWYGIKPLPGDLKPIPSSKSLADLSKESTKPAAADMEGEKVLVSRVVDGDTIEISTGKKVRLLGVDTPETVDPRKSVQCFGKEASNEAKKLLGGKEIVMQKDVSETDKYGRELRFIYLKLENGEYLFVNDYLIREGFAKVLTIPPDVKYSEQFLDAQREARLEKRGLWGRC